MKRFILFTFILLIGYACQKEEIVVETSQNKTSSVFYGYFEDFDQTKTQLDINNNIRWEKGDQILIFNGSTLGDIYQVSEDGIGETSASFEYISGITEGFASGSDIQNNIAFYPMNSKVKCAKGDNLENTNSYELTKIYLPETQEYCENSFASGSFPMVAVTKSANDYKLTFRNICGGVKLQLKGDSRIKKIAITGNNDEILCGYAKVTAYADGNNPYIELQDGGTTSVTLDCGTDGVQLDPDEITNFIFSIPPTKFTKGFRILITDIEGRITTLKTSKEEEVFRSSLLRMPAVTVNSAEMTTFRIDDTSQRILSCKEGKLSVNVTAVNAEFEVIIPEQDWLSMVDSGDNTSSVREFTIKENNTDHDRETVMTFLCSKHNISYEIPVKQLKHSELIDFTDQEAKAICISSFDTDEDKELSIAEAAAVTGFGDIFTENTSIRSFDEIQYFTSVTELNNNIFNGCTSLESFDIPDFITDIKSNAFSGCENLSHIKIGAGVSFIDNSAFAPKYLKKIEVSENNDTYDSRENCNAIVETASNNIIIGCINSSIVEGITTITTEAFYGTGMMKIVLPSTIEHIGALAFSGYSGHKEIYCNAPVPPVLDCDSFFNSWHSFHTGNFMFSYTSYVYVPEEYYDAYKTSWGQYNDLYIQIME